MSSCLPGITLTASPGVGQQHARAISPSRLGTSTATPTTTGVSSSYLDVHRSSGLGASPSPARTYAGGGYSSTAATGGIDTYSSSVLRTPLADRSVSAAASVHTAVPSAAAGLGSGITSSLPAGGTVVDAEFIARIREDSLNKDRLLQDAQQQVRELLTFKEQATSLKTELQLQGERLRAKEAENEKLHKMLMQEREDREGTIRNLTEKMHATDSLADTRSRRQEDRVREVQSDMSQLQKEVERKAELIRSMEKERLAVDRLLNEERDRHEQTKLEVTKAKAETMKLESKLDEAVRNSIKADSSKTATVVNLNNAEQQINMLKEENTKLRRRKDELVVEQNQLSSQKDQLTERLHNMTLDMEQLPKLRQEISALMTAREEVVNLRHNLDETNMTITNERSQRRTLELEREQFQLQTRSLEQDMKKLENDLHRSQCDAAEKHTLRRELDEVKDSLEVSHKTVVDLQKQLAAQRDEVSRSLGKHEGFHNACSAEFALLRSSLEAAIYQNPAAVAAVTERAEGGSVNLSNISNGSTAAPSATTALDVSGSKNPLAALTQHSMLPSCEALFTPTRAAILEVATVIAEERSRKNNLQRLLEVEQTNNSSLEESLRAANHQLNNVQLKLSDMNNTLQDTEQRLKNETERAVKSESTGADNLVQLSNIFGDAICTWPTVLQNATRVATEVRELRKEADRLNRELGSTTTALAAEKQGRASDNTAAEVRRKKEVSDLELLNSQRANEASNIQNQLKDALKKAAERNDETMKDLAKLQDNYESTLRSLQDSQRRAEMLEKNLAASEKIVSDRDAKLQETRDELKLTQDSYHTKCKEEQKLRVQLTATADDLDAEIDAGRKEHEFFLLVARACLGMRQSLKSVVQERNAVLQLSQAMDQALRIIADDAPDGIKPKKTLRVVAIAVLANNRFVKMLQALRASRGSLNTSRNGSTPSKFTNQIGRVATARTLRGRANEYQFPVIANVPRRDIDFSYAEDEHSTVQNILMQLESADVDEETETIEVERSLQKKPSAAAFAVDRSFSRRSRDGRSSPAREKESLLQRISSGVYKNKKMSQVGPTALARTVSRMYSIRFEETNAVKVAQERRLEAANREKDALVNAMQQKEEQNQKYSKQIADLISQTSNMVDKRVVEGMDTELTRVRSKLSAEKTEKALADERIAAMQTREMKLMAQQNQLQNEARSLAIELSISRGNSPMSARSTSPSAVGRTFNATGSNVYGVPPAVGNANIEFSADNNPLAGSDQELQSTGSGGNLFGPMVQSSQSLWDTARSSGARSPASRQLYTDPLIGARTTSPTTRGVPAYYTATGLGGGSSGIAGRVGLNTSGASPSANMGHSPSKTNLMHMIRQIDDRISGALNSSNGQQHTSTSSRYQ